MAKYGIPINGRMTEVIEVSNPVPHSGTIEAFLAKQFPELEGWVEVPDWTFNGNPLKEDNTPKTESEIAAELQAAKEIQDALAPEVPE